MKGVIVLGAVALVASCVFAQDVFAQRSGSVKAATALLLPDMLADHGWSYVPCGGTVSPE